MLVFRRDRVMLFFKIPMDRHDKGIRRWYPLISLLYWSSILRWDILSLLRLLRYAIGIVWGMWCRLPFLWWH